MKRYSPGWRNRQQELHHFQTAQRRVEFFRFALPAAVVVLLTAMFVWPRMLAWRESLQTCAVLPTFKLSGAIKNTVLHPVLHTLDRSGRPLGIAAQSATQLCPDVVSFDKPTGKFHLANGTWVQFEGGKGQYLRGQDELALSGGVRIRTQDGYDLQTDSALFLLREQRGLGKQPIEGTGPGGALLRAEGFQLQSGAKSITLTGRTHITYPLDKKEKS